jgi:hypothetical protein
MLLAALVAGLGDVGCASRASAQEPDRLELAPPASENAGDAAPGEQRDPSEVADQERAILERWLDEELYYHVLFKPADVNALRERVGAMSATELDNYFQQSERLRQVMESPEWQTVNRYYSYFRTLESVFSPEQNAQLAKGPGTLAPPEIMRLMNVLVDQYLKQQAASRASETARQANVQTRTQFVADQERMRQYALQRSTAQGGSTYFAGYTPGSRVIRRDQYRVPAPLITSREVAQLMVWRSFWYGP